MQQNLKVRTIDVNISQGQPNLGDPESSILINSGHQDNTGPKASVRRDKHSDWDDSDLKKTHKHYPSGITTNEITLNQQNTILNEQSNQSKGKAISSGIDSLNEAQAANPGTVKIIVHDGESARDSADLFHSSIDTSIRGGVQVFQKNATGDSAQVKEVRELPTESKEYELKIAFPKYRQHKSTSTVIQSALQKQAMNRVNESQTLVQTPAELQDQRASKDKKRPRKRYYNGFGKVPSFVVDATIPKDTNRKISRVFSGKTWNRNPSQGMPSASLSSTKHMLNRKRATQSGLGPQNPYPSYAIPLNFLGKDAQSQPLIEDVKVSSHKQDLHRTVTNDAIPVDHSFASELDIQRISRPSTKIHVNATHLTLDQDLAVQLAHEGALVGMSNPKKEFESLSRPQEAETDKALLFTLDQYRWAQRQKVYEHKESIGNNSLGRRIVTASAAVKRADKRSSHLSHKDIVQSSYDPTRPSQGDFMMEEAAISHLMHRANNVPKIHFKLAFENDDKSESRGTYAAYNTVSKSALQGQNRRAHPGSKSVSYVGMKPKILGSSNDVQNMSTIGKYLLNDRPDQNVPDSALDYVTANPNNSNAEIHLTSQNLLNSQAQIMARRGVATATGQMHNRESDSRNKASQSPHPVKDFRQSERAQTASKFKAADALNSSEYEVRYGSQDEPLNENANRSHVTIQAPQKAKPRVIAQQYSTEDTVLIEDETDKQVRVREKYEYMPKEGEFRDDELIFSSGNIYHEAKNPATAKLFNTVRGNIDHSHNQRFLRRQNKDRIFNMIKKSQNIYNQTLVEGEELGHCKGVNDKNAADRLYQNRLRTQRFLQKQEDRYEEIRAKKPLKEQMKIEARKRRVQERIAWIEQAKKVVPDLHKPCPKHGHAHTHGHHHSDSSSDDSHYGFAELHQSFQHSHGHGGHGHGNGHGHGHGHSKPQMTPMETSIDQSQMQTKGLSPITEKEGGKGNSDLASVVGTIVARKVEFDGDVENGGDSQDHKHDSIDNILDGADGTPQEDLTEQRIEQKPLTVNTQQHSSFSMHGVTQQLLGLQGQQSTSVSKLGLNKTKKLYQRAQKKVKLFKEIFGLKAMSVEQTKAFEQVFVGRSMNASPLLFGSPGISGNSLIPKMLRLVQSEQFITFKLSHNRAPGAIAKRNKIFTKTEQLGLEDRPDFHAFFMSQCEDTGSHNPKVQRLKFKKFLQDRYSEVVGEKILLFLENKFQTLFTFDKKGYCNVVMEFINQGPELYKRLIFSCLSRAQPGFICEHDIYALLENFKQRDSYYFFKELITLDEVPRDFATAADNSDDIFFEAFAEDVKAVAKALHIKKRLFGIEDTDINVAISSDVRREQFSSAEDYEEEQINQIDFLIGMICNQTSKFQDEIASILIQENQLNNIRTRLIELVQENGVFMKNAGGDLASQKNLSSVDHKRPVHTPCLGSGIVTETGKKLPSECCYLTYEDFNKLVIFKNGRHSSLVEDLIDHMTNCLISIHDVEIWCSHLRDINSKSTFTAKNIIEFVSQMNVNEFGNTKGLPPPQAQVKKRKLGIEEEIMPHKITTPYTCQDHYSGEDYIGKLLIRKVPKTEQTNKKLDKQKAQLDVIEQQTRQQEGSEAGNQGPIDGEDASPTGTTKTPMVLNTFLVNDDNVYKLIEHRSYFGQANFFRVFRIFYQLAASTKDAQNNPFALTLDENSVVRNFESAFGIKNEEIALRFFRLFMAPLGEPKLHNIDIMRWFFVIQNLCDNANPKKNNNFQKLAFNFFDYDNNGDIGSVDILNLKRSLDSPATEEVIKVFRQQEIQNRFCKKFKLYAAEAEDRAEVKHAQEHQNNDHSILAPILQNKSSSQLVDEYRQKKVTLSLEESVDKSQADTENSEVTTKKEPEKTLTPDEHVLVLEDPWNHFLVEVQALRDYYVDQAVKSSNPKTTNYKFLTQKVYSLNFMNHFQNKFGLESPTLVTYLKKILCYQFELKDDLKKENGDVYTGFTKEGYDQPKETQITPELIEMQKMLFEMSTYPKPPVDQ